MIEAPDLDTRPVERVDDTVKLRQFRMPPFISITDPAYTWQQKQALILLRSACAMGPIYGSLDEIRARIGGVPVTREDLERLHDGGKIGLLIAGEWYFVEIGGER